MKTRIILITLLILLNSGCSTLAQLFPKAEQYQIDLPDGTDADAFTKYKVPQVPFITESIDYASFGEISITLKRSATFLHKESGGFHQKKIKNSQDEQYTFELTGIGGKQWKGTCESHAEYYYKWSGFFWETFIESKEQSYLHASASSGNEPPIELHIERNRIGNANNIPSAKELKKFEVQILPLTGYVRKGDTQFTIRETSNLKTPALFTMYIGFYIYDGEQLVAAVQNVANGSIYINNSLAQNKKDLAIAASALLVTYYDLYYDTLEDSDEE